MTPDPSPPFWERPPAELARALFECARDAVLILDAAGRVTDGNPAAAELFGRAVAGTDVRELLDGADRVPPAGGRCHLRTAAGFRVPVCATASALGESATLLTLRSLRDPTDPQRAEDSYRGALEGSLQGVMIHQDARIRYANPSLARMFGYDGPAELVGRHLWDTFVLPEHLPMLQARTAAILAGESVPPHPGWWAVGKDGRRLWVATTASRIEWDGRPAVVAFYLNISEQKQAEDALRASERFVQAITAASPHTMYVFDRVQGRTVWANRQIADDLGYTAERARAMGANYLQHILHPDDLARLPERLARWDTAADDDVLETEYRVRHADGSWRWFVGHDAVFARGADGRVTQFLGTTQDVTERRRTEDALRESEARLTAMVTNSPGMAIQWYDGDGRVVLWNRASEEMFGFAAAEAVGRTLDQLIHTPDEFRVFRETCAAIARTGETGPPTEYTFRRRSGEPGTCLSTVFAIPGPGGASWFVCMDIDITARKRAEAERERLEAQVRQAQKLESLGILAGGIAHDFNNLLTSILGYSSLAALDLPLGSPTRAMIGEIEKAATRAAELTGQMLAYSGRGKFVVQAVELDDLAREMHKLLLTVVSKKAAIRLELAPVAVEADATQIRQVVMNLLTNASDALDGKPGAIAIRTGARALTADELRSPFVQEAPPAGRYAFLEVEDTGCGMSEDTLARIFDPFFTTKFTGRGLGLAAVLGIIRGHQGSLQIDTAPGRGTTFRVFLPTAPPAPPRAPVAAPPAPRGSGRILVVDDEENVRLLVRRILEEGGFKVFTAADGLAALRELHEHRDTLRAVLLDLTMPHLDGWEVASRIRAEAPGLPVVMMSGYNEEARRDDWPNVAGFIQKPFRAGDLLDRVCRSISGQRAVGSGQ